MTAAPGQTVGPFFHLGLAYPGMNELVPPTHPRAVRLTGRVLDGDGRPVPDAVLEIWQLDPQGHVCRATGSLRRDGWTFTGWGRAATDADGRYAFSTLEPGPAEPGRAPFFAVTVLARGLLDRLFTRAYPPGAATARGSAAGGAAAAAPPDPGRGPRRQRPGLRRTPARARRDRLPDLPAPPRPRAWDWGGGPRRRTGGDR